MLLTGFATASFLCFGTLLVVFGANATEIIAHLQLDYAELGLLGSMLSLGLGVGIVVAGPIVDRVSWRPLFVFSCSVVIGAATTVGTETTYETLLVHMISIGLGAGFYETVVNAMVIESFGGGARRRLLFIHSGAAFAACVAPLLIGWLRESFTIEWHDTFVAAGLLHAPLILSAFFLPGHRPTADPGDEELLAKDQPGDPASADDRLVLASLCVAAFAYVGVEAALTIFVVDFVAADLGLDALRSARTISAFWGGLFVGRVVSGLRPNAPGAATIAGLAVVGACLLLTLGMLPLSLPEAAMMAVGLVLSSAFPVLIGLAGRALPSAPATSVGLAGGLGSLGGFVVPWVTGDVARSSGLPYAIASLSGWLVLLAVAAALVRVRRAS